MIHDVTEHEHTGKGAVAAEIKPFRERRNRSIELIKKLVVARTEMLTLYSKLADSHPFKQGEEIGGLLEGFCQSLIDYTAEAHFQLYKYFSDNAERRVAVRSVAEQVYARIDQSTDFIVDFNDRYADAKGLGSMERLESDLSQLGELLADRIELEDQLIDAFSGSWAA